VPPNDTEALRAAMAYLLREPDIRGALGAAAEARIHAERSWDVAAERIVGILEDHAGRQMANETLKFEGPA